MNAVHGHSLVTPEAAPRRVVEAVVSITRDQGVMTVECRHIRRAWAIAHRITRDLEASRQPGGNRWVRIPGENDNEDPVRVLASSIHQVQVKSLPREATGHDHQAAASMEERAEALQGTIFNGLGEVVDVKGLVK